MKKRKHGNTLNQQVPYRNQPISKSLHHSWIQKDAITHVQLDNDEFVVLKGQAVISVQQGRLLVNGYILTPAHDPAHLSTGGENDLGLSLTGIRNAAQVPLLSQTQTKFTLSPADGDRPGFNIYLPEDTSAPAWLTVPTAWKEALETIEESLAHGATNLTFQDPIKAVVCGPKGVGKSHFARLLVNCLLNSVPQVAYVDCDCGQAELTPPGLVSGTLISQPLLGPPHTHLRQPDVSYFVGDTTPEIDPQGYVTAVQALLDWHSKLPLPRVGGSSGQGLMPCPLVINTCGWVRGQGLEMLAQVVESARPSHVFQLEDPKQGKNLPRTPFWSENPLPGSQLVRVNGWGLASDSDNLEGVSRDTAPRRTPSVTTAVESRTLMWTAWCQQLLTNPPPLQSMSPQERWQVAAAMAAEPPWEVPLDAVQIMFTSGAVAPEDVGYALNARIVGLLGPVPEAGPAPCLGLGLVRAVDMKQRLLYLLTPLKEEQLKMATTLVAARLELPSSLLQAGSTVSPYLALFCINPEATGSGGGRARRNVERTSLVKQQ